MDASARYIAQRVLADVQHLRDQGHIQGECRSCSLLSGYHGPGYRPTRYLSTDHHVDSIRSQLSNVLDEHVTPQRQCLAQRSVSALSLASQAKGKVPPPPPQSASVAPQAISPGTTGRAAAETPKDLVKALWDFEATGGSDELRFVTGDVIEVVERTDEHWWKGKLDGRVGLFPSGYVEAYSAAAAPQYPPPEKTPAYHQAVSPSPSPSSLSSAGAAATPRWKPPTARWSSGGSGSTAQPGLTGNTGSLSPGSTQSPPPSASTTGLVGLQPYVPTEEEKAKQAKLRKFGGRLGVSAATGAAFGAGAGLASNIF